MTDVLVVLIGTSVAGTLSRGSDGRLRFEYDDDYRAQPNATPISVSMPIEIRSHSDRVVTPWLWGLLPDNDAVLARWARQFHVSLSSPFAMLATPVGEDCAGAVRFVAADDVERVVARPGSVAWLTADDVAARLRELRADNTAWLGSTFAGQFSLAGAQAKTALLYEDGRWGVPSGAAATTHILKPAIVGFDDHDLNEHLCLDAARRAGLVVARTRVETFGDLSAVVVDRYDRARIRGKLNRVHQEDLCQALGRHPSEKYQAQGGPSATDIVDLIRRLMPPRIADESILRFVDALAWNWLIAGTDAHAKNYSLLLAGDEIRLAPLYDVASALPYRIAEQKLHLAMELGGEYRLRAHTANTWKRVAKELRLETDALIERVRHLASVLPDVFSEAIASPDIAGLASELPIRLLDAVAIRAQKSLRLVA
ncbi:MAG: type II toxin-antitoxin system HipA family toxin [Actinomycetota bacterium]|nr:type II toxin-antitoxin system HipA family toxin [Actinomycetota bacterium]